MEKDVRKTIAVWVIICFVVFSFGYAMVPLSNAIHRNPAVTPAPVKPVPAHLPPANTVK